MIRLNSLRARLVLWTILLEALALLIAGVILILIVQKTQNDQVDEALRLGTSQLNAVVDIRSGNYAIEATDDTTLRTQRLYAWVLTPQGVVASNFGEAHQTPLPQGVPKIGRTADSQLASGEPIRLLTSFLTEGDRNLGLLVLGLSLRNSQALMQQIFVSLGIVIPIILALSAIGGLFLANRALAPIAAITNTTRRINAADLSRRLEINLSDDEIGQLADTLNAMFGRLDRAFQRERQLTSDVSHELRTPLALLKAQLSLALSRPRDAAALTKMMQAMDEDLDRMTQLVEQMLALARLEQPHEVEGTVVNLANLLQDTVDVFLTKANERGVTLTLDFPPETELTMLGNADQLRRAFSNIVNNAVKYTERGGCVTIIAAKTGHECLISITDTGIGIDAAYIPRLFERFFRADSARTRDTGGYGLGLAIAHAIVVAHQGDIQVESQIGKGSTFTVKFPSSTL